MTLFQLHQIVIAPSPSSPCVQEEEEAEQASESYNEECKVTRAGTHCPAPGYRLESICTKKHYWSKKLHPLAVSFLSSRLEL
jgi:hypothetical protein